VKEHRLLQIVPMGIEAGAPLTHHLMYPCLSCCCWNHCKPWPWCLGKCFSTDGPWHHQCSSPLSNPLRFTYHQQKMSGHVVKEYYVAPHCQGHVPSAGRCWANPQYSPELSLCQLHVFTSLKKQLRDSQTKMSRLSQYSGSSNRPEKNVWEQVYSELYIISKVFCIHTLKVYGVLGCSFILSY